ncbi:MAG: hypothetical protein E6K93_00225 [Thaumarchaeota archaeon]|nr:MAG: hypothetical protein AUI59_02365 [Thaumarchaeota archaeon 13_1_40CM_2_39_13_1]OLE40034.1 MAG: hypothetical protein AUG16_05875 [Thaumarchaeota archaeon 13_1_20CM_2_39_20]TLX94300.1 MAG: hypothetical protein E6K93_00225 [Nitrososphaerota archaeon]
MFDLSRGNFPTFGASKTGTYVSTLKNYNLPPFILEKVAADCKSDLIKKGRIEERLQSMNDAALELLHKVFVDCAEDADGVFANYRFFAYISSMFHKCEILLNEKIPGSSTKVHKVPIAVKNNGMYVAVGYNKSSGGPISKREAIKFYEMVDDIKKGDHGNQLSEGILGSSVGFDGEALVNLEKLSKSRKKDPQNKIDFKTASFENRIYSVTKC